MESVNIFRCKTGSLLRNRLRVWSDEPTEYAVQRVAVVVVIDPSTTVDIQKGPIR